MIIEWQTKTFPNYVLVFEQAFNSLVMGVHSLWGILEPTSRAVRLESLSRKRMAVDASIWIYQFLKAVRDKSGNSLTSSHIVGFFRRICKLLYFGIQPVFVFDGGAPVLKRETINKRKERRQGKRDDATKTAQKLLALQLQKQHESPSKKKVEDKAQDDTEYRYLEEFNKPQELKEETPKPTFKGNDEYDLPQIQGFEYSKEDQRINTEEFKDMAEHIDELEGIDLNTIDPGSKEFEELPLTTQYMVLSQLRLRSRLRMGYTKEQLENIFPNSLDFSKFQIQMVQKRNFFTQRLMNITGMDDSDQKIRRVAGERGKEYKIQKTEGGWALSIDEGSSYNNPVDLDREERKKLKQEKGEIDNEDEDDDVDWEDVEIEAKEKKSVSHAMNSLPLPPAESVVGAGDSTIRSFMAYTSPQKKGSKAQNAKVAEYEDDISEDEALRQIEEIELIEAIQKSKKELAQQQELERQVVKNDRKTEEEAELFEDLPFDFETKGVASNERVGKSSKPAPDFKSLSEMDSFLGISPTKRKREEVVVSAPPAKKKPSIPSVPSWFNTTLENPFMKKLDVKTPQQKEKENESLVPWSEARDYLESKDEDGVVNEGSDEDVVEVQAPVEKPTFDKEAVEEKEDKLEEKVVEPQEPEPEPPVVDYDFSESEEENLVEQLAKEEKEHEEFQKDLNPHILNTFVENEEYLKKQQKKEMRDSDEVTVNMIKEVQELLARFGIPYITAPMEAEAQCAELLKLKLVDGIITDDSDVFLFGGDRVYKNMFHEKHYVEFYGGQDIERELGLSQQKLIELAQLLGSDYTEGLKGIGPVNSMEILTHFGDLASFRDWFIEGQFDIGKQQSEDGFLKSLRKKMVKNNVLLDQGFPDRRIEQAYLQAEVDRDKTEFVWGSPDLDRIRTFLMTSVGWGQERVDQVLVPLIRDLNKKKTQGTQSTLGEFYPVDSFNQRKKKRTLKLKKK